MNSPRILLNLKLTLSRSVRLRDLNGNYSEDREWHPRMRSIYSSLLDYLHTQSLLSLDFSETRIDDLVLTEDDLTQAGVFLWKSGAVYRWLGSFDKNPGKELDNYQILNVALQKMPKASRIEN